jgi:hypothetical protein
MAEIGLSILSRQCIDRWIPDQDTLKAEIAAWQEKRNEAANRIERRFTTQNARIKFNHLYASFQP